MKRLYRSRTHRVIGGVCGGIAEYLGLNVAIVRLFVLILSCIGSGIVLYIAGMLVIPDAPVTATPGGSTSTSTETQPVSAASVATLSLGAVLVMIGVMWLLDGLLPGSVMQMLRWARNILLPAFVILLGVVMLLMRKNAKPEPPSVVPLEQSPIRGGEWFRSRRDRKALGVCAGIAAAMNVDPTAVRLGWILLSFHSFGFGLLLYIILAFVLPEEPATVS